MIFHGIFYFVNSSDYMVQINYYLRFDECPYEPRYNKDLTCFF